MKSPTYSRRKSATLVSLLTASALALSAAVATAPGAVAAPDDVDCATVAWMDQSLTPEQRADALLAASTQHQKYRWLVEHPANDPQTTTFSGVTYPEQVACTPQVTYTDGPEGVRANTGVTTFPSQISLASTWNTDLAQAKGTAMADEAFDQLRNGILAPGLASGRTPLSGRTPEYFGEDAVLSGLLAAAQVNGIQNPTGDRAVMGELKHYVANEQEVDRQTSSSNVSERALREIYELPYEIALSESSPANIMCSYNQINGTYACENERLQTVLKDDLDYEGYIVSDFGAVHTTAEALMAGLDQELNRPRYFTPELLDAALAAGDITQERIDEAAKRVVVAYITAGLFDHPMAETAVDGSTEEHLALAQTLAEDGSVLLKNDDATLPLTADGLTVALFGPTASATETDGISAEHVCSLYMNFFGGRNTMPCENLTSPEEAIRTVVENAGGTVTWSAGTDAATTQAEAAAADVAIVFGYQAMGEFNDIADLNLHGDGDALIDTVAASANSTVVVLQTGSAVEMPWLDDVDAVLETWYGGDQMGPAIANLVFGEVNPSGKLPMTFPASLADTPTQADAQYPGVFSDGSTTRPEGSSEIRQVDYSEDLEVGYRWYEAQGIEPLFEFGHGLSYTTYEYSKLKVSPVLKGRADRGIQIRFRLTNTGDVAGTETAQVYVELPAAAGEPAKRLLAWEQVTLEPGERKNVTIKISADELADHHLLEYWDDDSSSWVTAKGKYTVSVGGSYDTTASATLTTKKAHRSRR